LKKKRYPYRSEDKHPPTIERHGQQPRKTRSLQSHCISDRDTTVIPQIFLSTFFFLQRRELWEEAMDLDLMSTHYLFLTHSSKKLD